MSSAIVQQNSPSGSALAQWNNEQISIIKQQIAPKCSDQELALFGQVCQRTGLDPFARQIYAISRRQKDGDQWIEKMSIQVSIDGFRLVADRTGKYAGSETYWCGPDSQWVDVWLSPEPPAAAKVLVWKTGSDHSFSGVARFNSYKQEYKGKLSSMWVKMPDVMIAKCAESLALRKAFPAELSGLYTREEMAQADNDQPVTLTAPAPNPITDRFNFIASKTGHNREGAIAAAEAIGVPPSSKQMTGEQFNALRNRMLAEWGQRQGAFKHIAHAMNSLGHLPGLASDDDAAVWNAWEQKVGAKLAEQSDVVEAEAEVA